jgi:hypothetical protein
MFVGYLYHITRAENINSILEYGLGAIAGNGINKELGVSGKVYSICFDPIPYILNINPISSDEDYEKKYIVDLICRLLMYNQLSVHIAVIKINVQMLDKFKLIKEPNEKYVYIYFDFINPVAFTYDFFNVNR